MFQDTENCYISEVVASLKKDKTRIRKLNRVDPRTLKRYNVFVPGSKYELVRRGNKIFKNRKELDATPLDEDNFYHFRHRDKFVTRESKHESRFVSVFNVDGTFLLPHQAHFKKIYKKCNRTEKQRADEILSDGTPYWADIYRLRVLKEFQDKQKYRKRKRKQREG